MRRAALLLVLLLVVLLVAAGCGGAHTTSPNNKSGRLVNKPAGSNRGVGIVFKGGTASLEDLKSKQTAVSLNLDKAAAKGSTAELDKGSCGAPKGLQRILQLGAVSGTNGSWSVAKSLTQLTASPLAIVVRDKAGKVLECGQAHSA